MKYYIQFNTHLLKIFKMLNVYDYIQQNISRIQEHITLSDQLYCIH